MKLLLLFLGLLLLAIYGDYGGTENLIGGIVCLVVCITAAAWHPDEGIEDSTEMEDISLGATEQGI